VRREAGGAAAQPPEGGAKRSPRIFQKDARFAPLAKVWMGTHIPLWNTPLPYIWEKWAVTARGGTAALDSDL
jgi:hypothetical protein